MMRPDQEAIDTFISITGVSEAIAVQKLKEHRGNLNEAVDAYFSAGDRNQIQEASSAYAPHDMMDIDDPVPFESHRPAPALLPFTRDLNPFSLLNSNVESLFGSGSRAPRTPFISHPREVREIPIEVKDSVGASGHSGGAPVIEDVTDSVLEHGPDIHGAVIIDDEDDDINITSAAVHATGDRPTNSDPSAPAIVDVPDFGNDIEEEMIRAAIDASKRDVAMSNQQRGSLVNVEDPAAQTGLSEPEDDVLAHAVSLSLQTAEQEKALRELGGNVPGTSEVPQAAAAADGFGKSPVDGRQSQLEVGNPSFQDEAEDVEEPPLIRRRRRRLSSSRAGASINIEEVDVSSPSSPRQEDNGPPLQHHGSDFPNEWGGISSEEHDEAVMLEAAMFGGIPEGGGFHLPYAPQPAVPDDSGPLIGPYPRRAPRPPSPSLTAQRLIREQQDDEYLASLQADREKELKAKAEADAALAEQRRKEDELCRKLQEEQENERQLAAKEASLPQEPTPDDENAVTLLVRMPDGSRRGRRFLKSDNLQCLFNFIDVARVVKPGSYRLVRPYPRRAFGDGDSSSSLDELGLTSKQEALYLELI